MISVVVPTYNERHNIAELVERSERALARSGEEYELIIVDDNSPDGTATEITRLQSERPWLKLIVREKDRDLSLAVLCGWQASKGEILGCMDGDLQHPPEYLERLIERLRTTGSDVVIASRYVQGGGVSDWKMRRRVVSWSATMLARIFMGVRLRRIGDPMSGFFIFKRSVVDKVPLKPMGYKILLEVLMRGRYQGLEEVPFVFEERSRGGSKMGAAQIWLYLLHLVRLSLRREA